MDGMIAELNSRMLNQAHWDDKSETYFILKKAEVYSLIRMQPFFGNVPYEYKEITIRRPQRYSLR